MTELTIHKFKIHGDHRPHPPALMSKHESHPPTHTHFYLNRGSNQSTRVGGLNEALLDGRVEFGRDVIALSHDWRSGEEVWESS